MTILLVLIPVALVLGGLGLAAFLWALRSGQYEDMEGAANRILFDEDDEDKPGGDKSGGDKSGG
jgi:cbb3-type cytochrome oxidase maturation protein